MYIVKKLNKLGHSKAYQVLKDGKLLPISWMKVHQAINNGCPVIIKQP